MSSASAPHALEIRVSASVPTVHSGRGWAR